MINDLKRMRDTLDALITRLESEEFKYQLKINFLSTLLTAYSNDRDIPDFLEEELVETAINEISKLSRE